MSYFLGIDLGTTYTAAALWRKGRVEMASLGSRAPVIPSVVLVREDGHVLTGEAAARRAVTEPERIAREFKRRIGDPTPIIVAGTPYSADALTARLLRAVAQRVEDDQDGPPEGVAVTHPANWTGYKKDLLQRAIQLAGLGHVRLVTEPEAAAIHYASQERVDPGRVVAAYDLGGGTFDAAVLRRTVAGWQILGHPDGVERLGGIDFDEAVFNHVVAAVGPAYDCLDPEDPAARAAVTRLRQECVDAKEALTSDTDVTIPVLLPTLHDEVRLTRTEFEDMIRPALGDSITALRRALRSACVAVDQVSAVVLVGGSSRIPLVAQLVGSTLGRPVAVDAHPKHSVALGAAIIAADQASPGAANTSEVESVDETTPPATFWTAPITPVGGTSRVPVLAPSSPPGVQSAPAAPSPSQRSRAAAELALAERRRHRALGLVAGGAAALVIAFGSVVALGQAGDQGQPPGDPAGVPTDVLPGVTSVERPPLSSGDPGVTSATTTLAEDVHTPTTAPARTVPPPTTAPTTTGSTTTTESTTTTTEAPTTTEATTTSVP
ncbi:MAG: Hsp70 family protein [Acidimicrobiales bacterium]